MPLSTGLRSRFLDDKSPYESRTINPLTNHAAIEDKLGLRHYCGIIRHQRESSGDWSGELRRLEWKVEETIDLSFGLRRMTWKTSWICEPAGNSSLYAIGPTRAKTLYVPKNCGASLRKL